jgi:opacity protein-like surface antigen
MRKLNYAILLSAGLFLLSAVSLKAQTITAGGGVGYGSKSEDFNFQVNAYYSIPNLPLRIGGDVGFSKPEDNLTQIDGNANVHLMLVDNETLSIYGLTGLNVLYAKVSVGDVSESETYTGLNAGGGLELGLGFGRAFGEVKYIIGRDIPNDDEQLVIGAGIRVNISN